MNQKVCAIMQPTYMPWIGFFKLIDLVDKFVILDNVQLNKRCFQTRNRIKNNDKEQFLVVPTKKRSRENSLIKDIEIDGEKWINKHLNSIKHSYSKSKYFDEIFYFIETILNKKFKNLSDLNCYIIYEISKKLGLKTEFIKASSLSQNNLNKEHKLIKICREIEVKNYISPIKSSIYIENKTVNAFKVNDINIKYFEYYPNEYIQLGNVNIKYLSIIDLLFNHGFKSSLEILNQASFKLDFYENF